MSIDSANHWPSVRTRPVTPLHAARLRPTSRTLDPAAWAEAGIPLLRSPRQLVNELHRVHRPQPGTVVLAVLGQDDRIVAGASFPTRIGHGDGWQYRNAILTHLRHVVPHDLRLRAPVRTAVLLLCRRGTAEWTEEDGPWMWGLRDASSLHGLRCGAYIALADTGWRVIGEQRGGRHPHANSWSEETVRTISALPGRVDQPALRMLEAPAAVLTPQSEPARIAAH